MLDKGTGYRCIIWMDCKCLAADIAQEAKGGCKFCTRISAPQHHATYIQQTY